ncbi:MaoC/PaaZ C-terminal domain-containing protein [Marinobacter sp. SBS5]|uniref:MaoC/PaaZ C-terminal domain-containing protein n=1 Tax=Marinobacter sp. SBS5 TaxID=3401754 RepID=UPI003AACBA7D
MPAPIIYRNTTPNLLPLFGRALLPKQQKPNDTTRIPELQAEVVGIATETGSLSSYRKVCGFQASSELPTTWPHILAFPLHLKLLTDPNFPLPLLGLVHIRNSITQHRPIMTGENLDIRVTLGNQHRTDKGIEFDLVTEARSAGTLIWEETSTNLFRMSRPSSGEPKPKTARTKPESLPFSDLISAPENIGRQYAKVAGDQNPIHLYALTAKAFGFPRAIAHGMWSKAHALAKLQQRDDWKDGAFTITCQFKTPLLLPGTAQLNWQEGRDSWDYQVLNAKGTAPHLNGRVDWL